jgi:hypothetical protein
MTFAAPLRTTIAGNPWPSMAVAFAIGGALALPRRGSWPHALITTLAGWGLAGVRERALRHAVSWLGSRRETVTMRDPA